MNPADQRAEITTAIIETTDRILRAVSNGPRHFRRTEPQDVANYQKILEALEEAEFAAVGMSGRC